MLNVIESACRAAIIHAIPGLGTCSVNQPSSQVPNIVSITTEGVNLTAMHEHQDILDPSRILTNDIGSMLRHYGVEACRASITREIDTVFRSHGIQVDHRHLNLLADVMTHSGGFIPFSRTGHVASSTSPFLKMSFETTLAFLRDAVLDSDTDLLQTPSAGLVVGKVTRVGTGAFDVLMPVT